MLTEEHRKLRIGKITSSRSPAILGLSPYATPEDVMREMVREHHGLESEFTGNAATDHGNKYEAEGVSAFELEMDAEVLSVGFVKHGVHKWLGDSADGWVHSNLHSASPLEVKCPYNGKIQTIADRPDYAVQCQHHAEVHGAAGCWYACYVPHPHNGSGELHAEWVPAFWPHTEALRQFHQRFREIVADEELSRPYLEPAEVDMSSDKDWQHYEIEYQRACEEIDRWTRGKDSCKKVLVEIAEYRGKPCYGTRYRVAPVAGRKSVNYKAALEDAGVTDLKAYTTVGEAGWRVTEVRGK